MTLSKFFWDRLAPKFLVRIRDQWRIWRLRRYKMKKVKMSKLIQDDHYFVEFNIIIQDATNPQSLGPFNITVPARGIYFAKRRIVKHLQETIDIEVLNFDRSSLENVEHVVYQWETESLFSIDLMDADGEILETINGVEARTGREAYLKIAPFVREHDMWDAKKVYESVEN